jgi:hypothetical protein
MAKKLLSGHTSAESAYLVEDYPYGFRLRCKLRCWLETTSYGTRFVSQTTNPKKGDIWNKPKTSTYCIVGVMFLDDNGHVQWTGVGPGTSVEKLDAFVAEFDSVLTARDKGQLQEIKAIFQAYDKRQASKGE